MTIKQKLKWLLLLPIIALLYATGNYGLQNLVILPSFASLENDEAKKNLERCVDTIQGEIHHLEMIAGDWAIWDDTYRFVQDRNPEYIESNLHWNSLESASGINLIYVVSLHGNVIWGEAYDSSRNGKISMAEFPDTIFPKDHYLLKLSKENKAQSGILITDKGPMFITSQSILKSTCEGPPMGFLIMGRFVKKEMIKSLIEKTRVDFSLKDLNYEGLTTEEKDIAARLNATPFEIVIQNDNLLHIYIVLRDMKGARALLLRAEVPRAIMKKGKTAAWFVSVSVLITITLIAAFITIVMKINIRKRTSLIESIVDERTQELQVAKAANQVKTQFLNNISHELRTPLNGITGFTDMLLDTLVDTAQKEYIHNIKTSSEDLLAIINDILDFSKVDSPDLEFQQIDFDPELLAYDVCEFYQSKIEGKPIELFCHIDEDLPVIVTGDPNRYRQVINKLLGNALKFTRSGEIHISLRASEQTTDKIKIIVTIQDTGIGIHPEFLNRIFEPFFQADGSFTREFGGTGLGLSICKEVAKKMGGDIQVESKLNLGSTFFFSAWFGKTRVKSASRFKTTSLKGKKILIMDDNQNSLEFLTHMLSSAEMTTIKISNMEEIQSKSNSAVAVNQPIDACIVTIKRQEKDLFPIAKGIRSIASGQQDIIPNNQRLPLIAISSVLRSKDCMEAGFNGFLIKPIRRDRLLLMLETVIGSTNEPPLPLKIANQYSIREEIKHSLNILLVEDNPMNQKIAKLMIQKAGYHVETANNGKEAVDEILKNSTAYHLVLMDIQMPEMDGITATKVIRDKGYTEIPIVALTAHAREEDREACLSAGMNDHITKPLKREKLYDLLRTWVIEK